MTRKTTTSNWVARLEWDDGQWSGVRDRYQGDTNFRSDSYTWMGHTEWWWSTRKGKAKTALKNQLHKINRSDRGETYSFLVIERKDREVSEVWWTRDHREHTLIPHRLDDLTKNIREYLTNSRSDPHVDDDYGGWIWVGSPSGEFPTMNNLSALFTKKSEAVSYLKERQNVQNPTKRLKIYNTDGSLAEKWEHPVHRRYG